MVGFKSVMCNGQTMQHNINLLNGCDIASYAMQVNVKENFYQVAT